MPAPVPTTLPPHAAWMDLPLKGAIARLAHGISPASLAMAHADWLTHLAVSPSKQTELAGAALRGGLAWLHYAGRSWGGTRADCVAPVAADRRFARPEWQRPPFDAMAQGFLLAQQWWADACTGVRGVSRHHEEVTAFTARQWLDMLSPSNSPLLNPQVLGATLASGGANLASGAANWWRDAITVATGGKARGVEAFRPAHGVALTPGAVVLRNDLIELIQYAPATANVAREPVLVVPSWIMKFYILDLTPDDSLVRYLVGRGHTVFMVSWRNPGSADRELALADYVEQGVLAAIDAVRAACLGAGIHAAGYCLGGTLLAIAAALQGRHRRHPLRTVSLLAAQVDFEEPGELGLFIDESQIAFLEDLMAARGYLDGREMAGAFQLINSKDLVWSKLVHEYLMGAQTPMTAMRAWNADATRLPARMHSEYLRQLYLHNALAEGDYQVRGERVDLGAIRVPVFALATERDHVSPWRSVYKVRRLVRGPTEFVLASGGHNVGIVSPPSGPAAHVEAKFHRGADAPGAVPADPDAWLARVPATPGSWWPCWDDWLGRHSTGPVPARAVEGLRVGGQVLAAPGSYVFQE